MHVRFPHLLRLVGHERGTPEIHVALGPATRPADGAGNRVGVERPSPRYSSIGQRPSVKPLGNPSQNGTKFFAASDILESVKDRSWLVKVTNIISQHWQHNNARKKNVALNGARNGHTAMELTGAH